MIRAPSSTSRAGVSLVELVIVMTVMAVLAKMLVTTSDSMGRTSAMGAAQGNLQTQGEKALASIVSDLRRSSFRELDGKLYPFVFDDGVPGDPAFAAHAHVPAVSAAAPGSVEAGPQRAIVFVHPSDLDRDGRPEVDADLNGFPELDGDGDGIYTDLAADIAALWDPLESTIDVETSLCWSHDEISYVVVAAADGRSVLERRVNGDPATARVIARSVDRIQFDTPESSGFEVPQGAVRVRILLRTTDSEGHVYKSRSEVTIGLSRS